MSSNYSDVKITKILLPFLSIVLLGQFLLLIKDFWWQDWLFWFILLICTFCADIIAQARKQAEAPLLVNVIFALVVYLAINVILIKQKDLLLTFRNIIYLKGYVNVGLVVLFSVFWGLSHGERLSSVRAYWNFNENNSQKMQSRAFSPPSLVFATRRVLFLGFAEHLLSWYLRTGFYYLLTYWVFLFFYIATIQFWGLSINLAGMGLEISKKYLPIWTKSLVIFLILIIGLSLVIPRNIFTIEEEKISRGIVYLLGRIHTRQTQNGAETQKNLPPIEDEKTVDEFFVEGNPSVTGWIFIVFMLFQLIVLVFVPGLIIAGLLGWLIYQLVRNEYTRLEGLPLFFTNVFFWLKQLFSFKKLNKGKDHVLLSQERIDNTWSSIKQRRVRFIPEQNGFYRQMVKTFHHRGLQFYASMTPFEYGKKAGERWPELTEAVKEITNTHVQEKYGNIQLNPTKISVCKNNLHFIRRFFDLSDAENPPYKKEIPRL